MPTVLRSGAYRFFFYAADGDEPPHVHVESGDGMAKFWLQPVRLHRSYGFAAHEINKINKLIERNRELLTERWDEFFNG